MQPAQIERALLRARTKIENRLRALRDLRTQSGDLVDFAASETALQSALHRIDERLRRLCRPVSASLRSGEDEQTRRS